MPDGPVLLEGASEGALAGPQDLLQGEKVSEQVSGFGLLQAFSVMIVRTQDKILEIRFAQPQVLVLNPKPPSS